MGTSTSNSKMRISILILGACSAMSLEGMHGLTAEDVNKCQDLDCLSTIVQEVFGMEPAPKGDDFLELWKWYSKVRALIGSMQTQATLPGLAKRFPRPTIADNLKKIVWPTVEMTM